jgi:hypothetical protein
MENRGEPLAAAPPIFYDGHPLHERFQRSYAIAA